ncbi:MAG: Lon protease [Pseudomonadota bacterium]
MNLPLFPLGTVLFPGGWLPLQIFEVRYLDLIQRCQRDGTPFGVVCLSAGQEVQQPDPKAADGSFASEAFHPVGTLAHLVEVKQPRPGLLLVACQGGQRFRVQSSERLRHGLWNAEVELLAPDQATAIPDELRGISLALRQLHGQLRARQPELVAAYPGYQDQDSPWQEAGWVANRWAELLPLPPESKQGLLALDSPLLRLELVGDALEQLGIAH